MNAQRAISSKDDLLGHENYGKNLAFVISHSSLSQANLQPNFNCFGGDGSGGKLPFQLAIDITMFTSQRLCNPLKKHV